MSYVVYMGVQSVNVSPAHKLKLMAAPDLSVANLKKNDDGEQFCCYVTKLRRQKFGGFRLTS